LGGCWETDKRGGGGVVGPLSAEGRGGGPGTRQKKLAVGTGLKMGGGGTGVGGGGVARGRKRPNWDGDSAGVTGLHSPPPPPLGASTRGTVASGQPAFAGAVAVFTGGGHLVRSHRWDRAGGPPGKRPGPSGTNSDRRSWVRAHPGPGGGGGKVAVSVPARKKKLKRSRLSGGGNGGLYPDSRGG